MIEITEEEKAYVVVKICMMGEPAVGKTSLIKRYVYDEFDDRYLATIGTKVTKKEMDLSLEGKDAHAILMLWDIMGHKKYIFSNTYFRGAAGALFVADITNKESIDNFEKWYSDFVSVRSKEEPIIILLNKNDLESKSEFNIKHAWDIISKFGDHDILETSAKTGRGVEEAFHRLAEKIIKSRI